MSMNSPSGRKMVEQHLSDNSTGILFQQASDVKWVPYKKLHVSNYRKVRVTHRTLKGLDPRINPDKPPRNFRDAMKALDKQAWAAAYNSEFVEFQQRKAFKVVRPEPGERIHDTLTRLEYKEDNCDISGLGCTN